MLFFVLFLLILIVGCSSPISPTPPLLPPQFSHPFHEWGMDGTCDGAWYYDIVKDRGIEAHDNTSIVYWCSSTGIEDSGPCNIISENGKRYITFPKPDPKQSKCCFCCSTSTCGGIVFRDWLNPAKYAGQSYIGNVLCNVWTIKGNDLNWWYTDVKTGYPVRYTEKSNQGKLMRNYTYFDMKLGPPSDELFDLPESCEDADYCDGFCSKWRD